MHRDKQTRESADNSNSAILSHDPFFGVWCISKRRATVKASGGGRQIFVQ